MTDEQIAELLNKLAAENPFTRRLQGLRDLLTDEAYEMLRVLVEETLP
ncbi:hypothetical protein [Bradyrhizobium prioriisuperbiae]|nr:hypothetical protein [Bradyrhizobium prioritasuperba]